MTSEGWLLDQIKTTMHGDAQNPNSRKRKQAAGSVMRILAHLNGLDVVWRRPWDTNAEGSERTALERSVKKLSNICPR